MIVEFIIGTAVLFVILLLFSKKKKPDQETTASNGVETGDWKDEYGVQFSSDKKTLIKAPVDLKEYIIPNGVISIRSNAFDGCSNLKSVTIPNSVKQIGRFVFNKCDSLSAIHIPDGNMERFKRMLPSNLHSLLIESNTTGINKPDRKESGKKEGRNATQEIDGHEYVDLGLPSGVVWATCNLGANEPEEHGLYLQWGNAKLPQVLKPDYSQWNMPFSSNGVLTKYNTRDQCGAVDNRVVLHDLDDAASVNWSTRWHIPTKDNFKELIINCTWEWKQQNGVNGYLVTSKINGNNLFFPTTGLSMVKSIKDAETTGCYWTSSLHVQEPIGAWGLDFSENKKGMDMLYRIPRFIGMAIRPVSNKLDFDTLLRAVDVTMSSVSSTNLKAQPSANTLMDYVRALDVIVSDYCQNAYGSRPSFHISLSTNFLHTFNFDGIDMAEIQMAFEKKFSLEIIENHPFTKRLADDTDYSVALFLSSYGLF